MEESLNSLFEERSFNFKKEVGYYLFFWPYFLMAIVLCLIGSFIYLRYQTPIYSAQSQIQIKEGKDDASTFLAQNLQLFNSSRIKMVNEIGVITSGFILGQVVDRLDLQTRIFSVGSIRESLQDQEFLPFKVNFHDRKELGRFEVTVENGEVNIIQGESVTKLPQNNAMVTDKFSLIWIDTLTKEDKEYRIVHVSRENAIAQLKNTLSVLPAYKGSEIIDLKINGPNRNINRKILDVLIAVLQEDQVAEKRAVSEVSIKFIDERLAGLSESIDTISENTIEFQKSNRVYDPPVQTSNALGNLIKGQDEALRLNIQLEIARSLRENLEGQTDYELLPAQVGIESEDINDLIQNYNLGVAERKSLLIGSTDLNPLVIQITEELKETKSIIISGIDQYIASLQVSIRKFDEVLTETESVVASIPRKQSELRGLFRNFQIVEELYYFLLQRREEASIKYMSALPNLKVLSNAVSKNTKVSPKPKSTYLGALILGLLVPFGILYALKNLDNKINTREDVEQGLMGVSIVGEIPHESNKESFDDPRGIVAEATRVIRSNLAFMLPDHGNGVITVTSSIKGEGKSFVAFNLAQSYQALGKKVILVGADLRNPQIHSRLGIERFDHGLSSYLSSSEDIDFDSLISKVPGSELDFLFSGVIPPNPSELLMRPRMKELVSTLRSKYDLVIIDSAPMMLVSDTTPILPLSDLVVYVCRSQYTDKNVFAFIKDMVKRENIPSIAMVLNGIMVGGSNKSRFSYSYRYSYNYQYNYGYGYGYGEDRKKKSRSNRNS
ncbi:GumC family protein [Aureitalea marina]|uniref:non-specific protein-tyrosine kinase n=1 Tax=Aureitalea marina TaxID=930804 RepID=A0A2S7KNR1_9FLAO|nr:tyrosine-protein kinase family protein [Aureitalea marina]PQB04247.1 hypothetical protein BST85_04510 [Aureitalea marina]